MQLNYILVGDRGYPQSVVVQPGSDVEALAAAIKKSSELTKPSQVQIFLAKQDNGDWMSVDAVVVDALTSGDEDAIARVCVSALAPSAELLQHFTPIALGHRKLHLVVRENEPMSTDGRGSEEELDLQCLVVGDRLGSTFSMKMKKSDLIQDLRLRVKKLKFDHNLEIRVDGLCVYRAQVTYKFGFFQPSISEWLKQDNDVQVRRGDECEVPQWTRHKLDPESTIGDAFPSIEQGCVHVLVSRPQRFVFSRYRAHQLLRPFQQTASRLKNSIEVVELVLLVKKCSAVERPPFILLQALAGEGNTQMAFNLMARDDVEVFYVPCQDVEWEFSDRFRAFRGCLEKDVGDVGEATASDLSKQSLLYTYGFIWAVLTGMSEFVGPRTRDEVLAALEMWRERANGKYCVFFLDNIPVLSSRYWEKASRSTE